MYECDGEGDCDDGDAGDADDENEDAGDDEDAWCTNIEWVWFGSQITLYLHTEPPCINRIWFRFWNQHHGNCMHLGWRVHVSCTVYGCKNIYNDVASDTKSWYLYAPRLVHKSIMVFVFGNTLMIALCTKGWCVNISWFCIWQINKHDSSYALSLYA